LDLEGRSSINQYRNTGIRKERIPFGSWQRDPIGCNGHNRREFNTRCRRTRDSGCQNPTLRVNVRQYNLEARVLDSKRAGTECDCRNEDASAALKMQHTQAGFERIEAARKRRKKKMFGV
jgi:hypothetical protein